MCHLGEGGRGDVVVLQEVLVADACSALEDVVDPLTPCTVAGLEVLSQTVVALVDQSVSSDSSRRVTDDVARSPDSGGTQSTVDPGRSDGPDTNLLGRVGRGGVSTHHGCRHASATNGRENAGRKHERSRDRGAHNRSSDAGGDGHAPPEGLVAGERVDRPVTVGLQGGQVGLLESGVSALDRSTSRGTTSCGVRGRAGEAVRRGDLVTNDAPLHALDAVVLQRLAVPQVVVLEDRILGQEVTDDEVDDALVFDGELKVALHDLRVTREVGVLKRSSDDRCLQILLLGRHLIDDVLDSGSVVSVLKLFRGLENVAHLRQSRWVRHG